MTSRKQPGVAFWATVAIVVVLFAAYPLSIGPLQWLDERSPLPAWTDKPIKVIYAPLDRIIQHSETAQKAAEWYLDKWLGPDEEASPP